MRIVLQRVISGSVTVDGRQTGSVERGFVALVGITHEDSLATVDQMARKTAGLRVFDDEAGKMNRSLLDTGGGVLVVSQFTLYADTRHGRRPGFTDAARPEQAEPLVTAFVTALLREGVARVETGSFGAMMQVALVNDGPVTILLDSAELAS